MIDPKFIPFLVCPATKQPIFLADADLVAQLNRQIKQGKVINRAGEKITKKVEQGLIDEERLYFYIIEDGIPNLLAQRAILLTDN